MWLVDGSSLPRILHGQPWGRGAVKMGSLLGTVFSWRTAGVPGSSPDLASHSQGLESWFSLDLAGHVPLFCTPWLVFGV